MRKKARKYRVKEVETLISTVMSIAAAFPELIKVRTWLRRVEKDSERSMLLRELSETVLSALINMEVSDLPKFEQWEAYTAFLTETSSKTVSESVTTPDSAERVAVPFVDAHERPLSEMSFMTADNTYLSRIQDARSYFMTHIGRLNKTSWTCKKKDHCLQCPYPLRGTIAERREKCWGDYETYWDNFSACPGVFALTFDTWIKTLKRTKRDPVHPASDLCFSRRDLKQIQECLNIANNQLKTNLPQEKAHEKIQ